ncbi:MAG: helix-turn-helix domain-containing protein [bacterium]
MNEQLFFQIGLTKDQSLIYQTILDTGLVIARAVSQKSGLKRGLVYKILDQLISLKLIEKRESGGKVALFFPTHPDNLRKLLEKRREDIKVAESTLNSVMPKLSSSYNLISGKPNVQFFEGIEGMKEILDDSLTSQTEIYSYADIEAIQKYIPDVNAEYAKKRDKFGIKNKALLLNTEFARNFVSNYYKNVTDIKFIPAKATPFQTVMQIYDNKISYLTLSDKEMIGIIIEDKYIFNMHRDLFEYTWETANKSTPDEITPQQPPSQNLVAG